MVFHIEHKYSRTLLPEAVKDLPESPCQECIVNIVCNEGCESFLIWYYKHEQEVNDEVRWEERR